MLTDDDWKQIITVIGLLAVGFFLNSQYEICTAMPNEWFTGFISGLVFCVCFLVKKGR